MRSTAAAQSSHSETYAKIVLSFFALTILVFLATMLYAAWEYDGAHGLASSALQLWWIPPAAFAILAGRWHFRRHRDAWRKAGGIAGVVALAPLRLLGWILKLPFRLTWITLRVTHAAISGQWWLPICIAAVVIPLAHDRFRVSWGESAALIIILTSIAAPVCVAIDRLDQQQRQIIRDHQELLAELRSRPR